MTIDTGCSGSTVAFHLACESLRTGEAECALACGVDLILAPDPFIGTNDESTIEVLLLKTSTTLVIL